MRVSARSVEGGVLDFGRLRLSFCSAELHYFTILTSIITLNLYNWFILSFILFIAIFEILNL